MTYAAHHLTSRSALLTALGFLCDRLKGMSEHDLTATTRRHGWSTTELLVALDLDLQRLLRNLMMTSSVPVTHASGRCTYGPSSGGHRLRLTSEDYVGLVRGLAAAHTSHALLRREITATIDAISLASSALVEASVVAEGTRVCAGDFLQAWAQLLAGYLADLPTAAG